jgi:hypothetical protein
METSSFGGTDKAREQNVPSEVICANGAKSNGIQGVNAIETFFFFVNDATEK